MQAVAPPPYRPISSRGLAPHNDSHELPPSYSRRHTLARPAAHREPTEHVYHLDEKHRRWVTLKLLSSAKSSQSLPTFFEKENINAKLQINAEHGDSIHSVTATVTGRIITSADSSFVFLSHTLPIWSKALDIPRLPSPSEGPSKSKLLGTCEWDISIPLPRTVEVPDGSGSLKTCPLPETFLERSTPLSIQYDFALHISRGRLRSDSVIKTAFGYIPSSRPDPAPPLQRLAYESGQPLPLPHTDPEGWHTTRPVKHRGTMNGMQEVEVQSVLSIANPRCFARGAVIPLSLSLQANDARVLRSLADPSSVRVKLERRIRFLGGRNCNTPEGSWYEAVQTVGAAAWWPVGDSTGNDTTRVLEGEIKLAKDLRPTTSIAHFSISYHIVLCPFESPNYTPNTRNLLTEPVEIATMYAKGPRPLAYAPPAYDIPNATRRDEFSWHSVTHTNNPFA